MQLINYILIITIEANGNAPAMPMNAPQQSAVATGAQQADYSKQWAEYYRSIGKNDDAEAIENQIKSKVRFRRFFFPNS